MLDKKLLELLVCPISKTPLEYDREHNELISLSSNLAYPIRNDIPIMLESEARALTLEEKESWLKKRRK
ncbi:Protein of unknown function DUF343 [gamma proteobacterium HdN1]|nr:Protein of unknown function DUF343 [gamma proteobacterium HdN1]